MFTQRGATLDNFASCQVRDERKVGFEKVQFGKFFPVGPSNFTKDSIFDFTEITPYLKEPQFNGAATGVLVKNATKLVADRSFDPKLFFEFAAKRVARLLAFLYLTAREFPLEWHGLVTRSLTHQNPVFVEDDCGDYPLHVAIPSFELRS